MVFKFDFKINITACQHFFTTNEGKKKVKMSCLTVESDNVKPGPEVIKHFSCSTKLRLKFILLMNVKMPTSILTFISQKNDLTGFRYFNLKILLIFGHFNNYEQLKFHAQLSLA